MNFKRGYTLIELIVAVGLFALVILLTSATYFTLIALNRQVSALTTGVDNLSFALETMTRTIRTGTAYACSNCNGGSDFSFNDSSQQAVTYRLSGTKIVQINSLGAQYDLTDPSVSVDSLQFYATGITPGDREQARVTIVISGTVAKGASGPEHFTLETAATMRGSDIGSD